MDNLCKRCGEKSIRARDARYRYCEACKPLERKPRQTECEQCGADIRKRYRGSRFCFPCTEIRARMSIRKYVPNNDNAKSRAVTKYAVKVGFLPDPTNFICMDCKGRQAQCYDHRDYSKPLEVDPVCLRCNNSRGRGIPLHINHESTQLTTTAA